MTRTPTQVGIMTLAYAAVAAMTLLLTGLAPTIFARPLTHPLGNGYVIATGCILAFLALNHAFHGHPSPEAP